VTGVGVRQVRAFGTRYDNREDVFRGTIDVASIRIWQRPRPSPFTGQGFQAD
jgi:hypothetical protein